MGESGEGGGDDKIAKFPTKAARFRDSAGFDRKRTNAPPASPADVEKKPMETEPLTEAECEEIAQEIIEDLTPLALSHPAWNITEEVIEQKAGLLLQDANNDTSVLAPYFEEASRRDVSQEKGDIILHLAAARAYLDILALRRIS